MADRSVVRGETALQVCDVQSGEAGVTMPQLYSWGNKMLNEKIN